MADIKNIGVAAESVLALADKFKAVIEMAEALRGLQSVEQAISERNQALAKAKGDHEAALKALKEVQDEGTRLKAQQELASRVHDKALNDKNDEVLAEANRKSAEIIAKAQREAETNASTVMAEVNRAKTASDVAMTAAQRRLTANTAAAAELENKLATLHIEYDGLFTKMASLKSEAKKLAS